MEPRVAAVVLAAGGSSRLGTPKQLLSYNSRSLLRHAAETAVDSSCHPVVVVLGAEPARMEQELAGLPVPMAINPDWQRGIGSSIRAGVQALESTAEMDAVVLLLCDQPLVGPEHISRLIEAHVRTSAPVVASEYQGTMGVPALFARSCFERLRSLPNDKGAKGVILAAGAAAHAVPFPHGGVDVDTKEDYARLVGGATKTDLNQYKKVAQAGSID